MKLILLLAAAIAAFAQPVELKVAAVQFRSSFDIAGNTRRIAAMLEKLAAANVKVAVFPECAVPGYHTGPRITFDAEQGLAGGAAITVNTKSGTNDLHGAAFAYHSNSRMRARNYFFQGQNPKNIFNIPGFVLGGPILRNKLFYFGGWEGTRQRNNVSSLYTVPTDEMRAGNFSAFPSILYDPFTGDAAGRGRAPLAGNMIPAARQSAISRKMQALVPAPNQPGVNSNYFGSDSQALDRDNYDLKINWVRNPQHVVWAKYGAMKAKVTCSFGLGAAGGRRSLQWWRRRRWRHPGSSSHGGHNLYRQSALPGRLHLRVQPPVAGGLRAGLRQERRA